MGKVRLSPHLFLSFSEDFDGNDDIDDDNDGNVQDLFLSFSAKRTYPEYNDDKLSLVMMIMIMIIAMCKTSSYLSQQRGHIRSIMMMNYH